MGQDVLRALVGSVDLVQGVLAIPPTDAISCPLALVRGGGGGGSGGRSGSVPVPLLPPYPFHMQLLKAHNPNAHNLNIPPAQHGPLRRFTAFNGAVSTSQLDWLQRTLERTQKAGLCAGAAGRQEEDH